MSAEFLPWFAGFAVRAAILVGLLWLMIKLRKLDRRFNFQFWGLLGVAVLASGLDMIPGNIIPYAGHPLAVFVLLVGVKKVVRTDYVEALLTIVVPYALVFAAGLFVLTPLTAHLRARSEKAAQVESAVPPAVPEVKVKPVIIIQTNAPVPKTNTPSTKTNVPLQVTNQFVVAVVTNVSAPPPAKPIEVLVKYFTVKGVTRNGANSAVTIQSGTKIYTAFLNETILTQTPGGPVPVRFADLDTDSVTLEINGQLVKIITQ
jgi:energy-converting hydrogenase Eha subunit A